MTNHYQLPDCQGCAFCQRKLPEKTNNERLVHDSVSFHVHPTFPQTPETTPETPPKSLSVSDLEKAARRHQQAVEFRILRKQLQRTNSTIESLQMTNAALRYQIKEKELELTIKLEKRPAAEISKTGSKSVGGAKFSHSSFFGFFSLSPLFTTSPDTGSKSTKAVPPSWRMLKLTRVSPVTTHYQGVGVCNN